MRWARYQRRLGCGILTMLLLHGRVERDADAGEPAPGGLRTKVRMQVDYQAPSNCPTRGAFIDQVSVRTDKATLATGGEAEFAFHVRIEPSTVGGYRASMQVRADGGENISREVPEGSCEDVVDALALIAAVMIDPDAFTASSPPADVGNPSPTETKGEPIAAPAPLLPGLEAVAILPATSPPRDQANRLSEPAPDPSRSPASLDVGLSALVKTGPSPAVAVGGEFLVGFRTSGAELVAPRVQLSAWAVRAASGSGESADFTVLGGSASLCPVRLMPTAWVSLAPCVAFEAGAVIARGEDVPNARSVVAPWLAAGIPIRLEWVFDPRAAMGLEVGPVFPLTRDRFVYVPDREIHVYPPVGLRATLGPSLLF